LLGAVVALFFGFACFFGSVFLALTASDVPFILNSCDIFLTFAHLLINRYQT
jgi:hypothetical protein